MSIVITSQDLVEYKPHISKLSGLDKRANRLDTYITRGIKYVENEMIINNIDLNNDYLIDNVSYKYVYLQYIYYLFIESCLTSSPSKEELELKDSEYNKYTSLLSKFNVLYDNNENQDETPKNIYNNITLKFG